MNNTNLTLKSSLTRREFVGSAAGIAAAAAIAPLAVARSAFASGADQLKVGLVGCGGRGTGAATNALNADPGVVLWSMGDAFQDRVESSYKTL